MPAGTEDLLAGGAYDRRTLMDKAAMLGFVVQVVRRHEDQVGFAVLPWRWMMERTFGWRDYERRPDASETMAYIAMGGLLLRRVAHPSSFSFQTGSWCSCRVVLTIRPSPMAKGNRWRPAIAR